MVFINRDCALCHDPKLEFLTQSLLISNTRLCQCKVLLNEFLRIKYLTFPYYRTGPYIPDGKYMRVHKDKCISTEWMASFPAFDNAVPYSETLLEA